MSPSKALVGFLALYALLNFFLVPTIRVAWKSDRTINKIARAGLLAGFSVLAKFALIAAITLMGLRLSLWAATLGTPVTVLGAQHLLRFVDTLLAAVDWMKGGWTTGVFIFSFVIAGIALYRLSRAQLTEYFAVAVRSQAERLRRARDNHSPEWEDIPPTPEMKELWAKAQQIADIRNTLPPGSVDRAKLEAFGNAAIQNLEAMDVARRLNIEIDVDRPPASTRLGKLWQFLSSSGLYADLKGAKAFICVTANVLLVGSLLSVTASPAGQVLQDRKAKLEDFAILLSAKESRSSRDRLPPQPEIQVPPGSSPSQKISTAQEDQGLRYLAAAFEHSIFSDPVWAPLTKPDEEETRDNVRREWTRIAIRRELDPHSLSEASISGLFPTDQWKSESETAYGYVQSLPRVEHESTIRKQFIADWKRENVKQFKDMSDKLRKLATLEPRDYRKLGWSSLHEWALGEVIAAALDGTSPESNSEFTKELLKAGTGSLQEALQNYYTIRFNQFVVGFANGGLQGAQSAVLSNENNSGFVLTSRTLNTMAQQIDFKPGGDLLTQLRVATGHLDTGHDDGKWEKSIELAASMQGKPEPVQSLFGSDSETIARSFPDYNSYFPLPGEITLRNSLLASWGRKNDAKRSEADAERSTNFEELENSSGVGGVLIGRAPSGTGTAGITDIEWHLNQGILSLDLRTPSGAQTSLGPFPASLAYQALLYATDLRSTAVTAITDRITGRDRILLHPALEDTAFGCRVIQADHWIFEAVEPDAQSPSVAERKRAQYQVEVYNDVARRLESKDQGKGKYPVDVLDAFKALSSSPLSAKQFNSEVVLAIEQCIKAGDLQRACPTSHLGSNIVFAEPVVADYFVSHLREGEYEPDTNLEFLTDHSAAHPWPFQFFILLPINDKESWYIGDLEPPIPDQVLHYVQTRDLSANLEELKDFTVLQRLFRTALAGRVDKSFSVERLSQLASDLQAYEPTKFPTPRWGEDREAKDSIELRFAAQLDSLLSTKTRAGPVSSGLAPTYARMQECSSLIRNSKNPESITDTQWGSACSFNDTPPLNLQLKKDASTSFGLTDLADQAASLRMFRAVIVKEGGIRLECPSPTAR